MAAISRIHPRQHTRTISSELEAFIIAAEYRRGLSANTVASDYWWPKMQCLVAAFRDWRMLP